MNLQEAVAAFRSHQDARDSHGIVLPRDAMYIPDGWKRNFQLAMDALPNKLGGMDALPTLTTTPNSAILSLLSTFIDPEAYSVLFAPNKAAQIIGEQRRGDWLMETTAFITAEAVGEVSSYNDYSTSGNAGVNTMFPQRQAYLFQLVKQYGEREIERAGLAKINWVAEIDKSANLIMAKFLNLTYFFGVSILQNYGLTNDPNLTGALTPGTKAAGNGNVWLLNGVANATANEVYNDILALFQQIVNQSTGIVSMDDKMVLAIPTAVMTALDFINTFGLVVRKMLKDSFPNMRIEQAVQYNAKTASNPQGQAAGNMVQLIVEQAENQKAGFCAFNEKMRAHPIILDLSAFKQKITGGSWGAVIRQPFLISQMVGV